MKQKIAEALKAKFVGVSDAILDRIATKLAKTITNEDDVTTMVEGVTFQEVLTSYGDARATEAQRTAIKTYETKYGLKAGEKVKDSEEELNEKGLSDEKETPDWARVLLDQNKALVERLNKFESEKTIATRTKQLEQAISPLPEAFRKGYLHASIDSLTDEQFATLIESVNSEVAEVNGQLKQKGAVFGKPAARTGGATMTISDEDASAIVDKLKLT